jgi:flagellar transcriptional activator FlhC
MSSVPHVQRAIDTSLVVRLIEFGARLQLLEHEFPRLSRETLIGTYKEICGESPPKGMLPFSTDWFLAWQPNVHASLFLAYHEFFRKKTELEPIEVLMRAYDFYVQEVSSHRNHDLGRPVFSITRAWTLIRLMSGMNPALTLARCSQCGGGFLVENHRGQDFYRGFICGLCKPLARAGKTRSVETCA